MSPLIVGITAFVGVAALVGGVAMMFRQQPADKIQDRLDLLCGANTPAAAKEGLLKQESLLAQPPDAVPGLLESCMSRFGNFNLLLEQADTSLTLSRLGLISLVLAIAGAGLAAATRVHPALLPVVALFMASLPLL